MRSITKALFRKKVLTWYHEQKRDLPWRRTQDPYKIWVSEIILQQTRVAQGLGYYEAFIRQFPTLSSLATAHTETVMKSWEGLGYYSRARNMQTAARQVMEHYDGIMPKSYEILLTLKGIGPYTAAAIASIAGNERQAVIDGNVYRVFSRFSGIYDDVQSTEGLKKIKELAIKYLDPQHPGDYNQALMELGALVCTPKKPSCSQCPLLQHCYAYRNKATHLLPSRPKKKEIPVRYFHYIILVSKEQVVVRQRRAPGIWRMLYEFPLIESDKKDLPIVAITQKIGHTFPGIGAAPYRVSEEISHKLTHLHIHALFYHFPFTPEGKTLPGDFQYVRLSRLRELPFPRIITRYLDKIGTLDPSRQLIDQKNKSE